MCPILTARAVREKEDIQKTAQGTQEQNEEGQGNQKSLCWCCWQEGKLLFLISVVHVIFNLFCCACHHIFYLAG